ncbi:hypothetical protein B0H13DRAFT_2335342 [Mycena leptocephala]|nr:hypothetical protein B0H13DRAFT_2335342 [Mycena leptocephala]
MLSNLPGLAIENLFTVATCTVTWADIDRMNVSITFSHLGVPYGIYPGVGDFNDIVIFTQPIPVLADFNLFAYMTCELTSPRQSEAKDRLVPYNMSTKHTFA